MSLLRYLCLFAYSGVFYVLFVFVLYTQCGQFPWIVHFLIAPPVISIAYLKKTERAIKNGQFRNTSN